MGYQELIIKFLKISKADLTLHELYEIVPSEETPLLRETELIVMIKRGVTISMKG
jgi:hypothetical protein